MVETHCITADESVFTSVEDSSEIIVESTPTEDEIFDYMLEEFYSLHSIEDLCDQFEVRNTEVFSTTLLDLFESNSKGVYSISY